MGLCVKDTLHPAYFGGQIIQIGEACHHESDLPLSLNGAHNGCPVGGDVMRWTIFVFIVLTVLFPRAVEACVLFVVLATFLVGASIAGHLVVAI
jgi:hypothetical protein